MALGKCLEVGHSSCSNNSAILDVMDLSALESVADESSHSLSEQSEIEKDSLDSSSDTETEVSNASGCEWGNKKQVRC